MAKPPLEGINPLDIYIHALGFHVAEDILGKVTTSPNPQLAVQVVQSVMTLSAFTTELFLKCLLCLETTLTPQGHHLFELFQQLKPETQAKIAMLWDTKIVPHRDREWKIIEANYGGSAKMHRDLPGAISASSRAFEKIRYSYEPGSRKDSDFNISDLPRILRRIILEKKPEWSNLGRAVTQISGPGLGSK